MANLTLRLVKGAPLTNQEVDDNFSALNTDKLELADLVASAVDFDNTASDLLAETVQAAIAELEVKKINTGDLRVGVTLFPTDTIYSGTDYLAVNDTADAEFNNTAVDIATGGVSQDGLIATVVSEDGIAEGEVTGVNVSLVGNIRKTAGNQNENADFYFEVYHRDFQTSTDTLIGTSGHTLQVLSATYEEYAANAYIAGPVTFDSQDRIVLKFYAGDVTSNAPEYDIQFGGTSPLRFSMPIALANVVQLENASDIIVASGSFANVLSATDTDVQTALETIDSNALVDAPVDTKSYVRSNGSWQELVIESEKLEIAHHYHTRMHVSESKLYTAGAYWGSEFVVDTPFTNGIYDNNFTTSTFSKFAEHVLPDTAFTGDLDLIQLRWLGNLAVADANIAQLKFEVYAVDPAGTARSIGETDAQFVTNTAFNDFQFDFFGSTFTSAGSTTILPNEKLRVDALGANPAGSGTATLRIDHDPTQGTGEGWAVEVVNYDAGVADFTYPQMPWRRNDGSSQPFTQFKYTEVDYVNNGRFRFGGYNSGGYTYYDYFGAGKVENIRGEWAVNSSAVGANVDWSLRNVDIDVLEGNYSLAVNNGVFDVTASSTVNLQGTGNVNLVSAGSYVDTKAASDYQIQWDSGNTDNINYEFKLTSGNTDVLIIPAPVSQPARFIEGRTWEWLNAANTQTTVAIDGEAGTIELNGVQVLTAADTPNVAGTGVVQRTSGMHWMPISKRQETIYGSSTQNELGHAIPIVDKNWTWDEFTLTGNAGVNSIVARIEFPQGAYVGDVGDLQMTVQVRLRHTGSVPIERILVGYGKRTPEGSESNLGQDQTSITSTTSAADYTAALTTTTGLMSVTADDQLYVDVYVGASAGAWEAIISDTGNGSDIATATAIGVYAGSKRFIGAQDVHIGGNDVRVVGQGQVHLDADYVNIGRDKSIITYVDSDVRTEYKSGGSHQFSGSSLEFRQGGSTTERFYTSSVQRLNDSGSLENTIDLTFQNYTSQPNAISVNRLYTTRVDFYSQSQGFQGAFVGTAASLYDADTLALQTDITNLQAQINALSANKIGEAPIDGKTYVRQNGEWIAADLGLDLLIYPFDGGLADTVYFAETMDGGASDTLVFDDAISPVLGGVSNSTYEVSPLISGLADMSTLAGANFNVDGGRASTTLFSSNFDGGAA